MTAIPERLAHWNTKEGRPYKDRLIDYDEWIENPSIGCMCAQGQTLYLLGGWSPEMLRDADQEKADKATAELLNISVRHSILLRLINDEVDGAPSIVLTNPEKILGDQAHVLLAFWLHLDGMKARDWTAALVASRGAAWVAAQDAAWAASRGAAWVAAQDAARAASWSAARAVAWASNEIQGAKLMRERGQPFFFLPLFGFADPGSIPPLPADYGVVGDTALEAARKQA